MLEGRLISRVALLQGGFYFLTGVWPLLDIDSFQVVTGPKIDLWLVRTVGILVAVIGTVLVTAWRRRSVGPEIIVLGMGSALGLTAIDIIYVSLGTIAPIYLADVVVEIGLAAAWAVGRLRS